ncbi:hypothetical protein DFJ74DRAFT_676819 [Hyaloraphidium curvatum]|nr:hypothetical protein DFJ74DRAFT_676819 [Hyaloraphidium curvatum]
MTINSTGAPPSGSTTPSSGSIASAADEEAERAAVAVMAGFRMNGVSPTQSGGGAADAAMRDADSEAESEEDSPRSPEPEAVEEERKKKKGGKKKSVACRLAPPGPLTAPRSRRDYPCPSCPRVFGSSGHLSRHRRIHLDLRPYACPVEGCGARFHRIDNMKSHANTHARRLKAEADRRGDG